jgi:hypothetical protein
LEPRACPPTTARASRGARLGERRRESAERVAGVALIALGAILLTVRLTS